jgi:hypothetical protein
MYHAAEKKPVIAYRHTQMFLTFTQQIRFDVAVSNRGDVEEMESNNLRVLGAAPVARSECK